MTLHDMHCHLNFFANGSEIAADAHRKGMFLFANTVTPAEWQTARKRYREIDDVVVGFGAHPWWTENNGDALACLEEDDPLFIGEIGLDFGKRHADSRNEQIAIFESIATWCATKGGRLLSIHSVHAAREALDILGETGALETCSCIFHWFTGPSDQLKRAIDHGCYFSAGPRMLSTKKGREYVKAIPSSRLLLETDYPPEKGYSCPIDELERELQRAADEIAAIKGAEALGIIENTSRSLLDRHDARS